MGFVQPSKENEQTVHGNTDRSAILRLLCDIVILSTAFLVVYNFWISIDFHSQRQRSVDNFFLFGRLGSL